MIYDYDNIVYCVSPTVIENNMLIQLTYCWIAMFPQKTSAELHKIFQNGDNTTPRASFKFIVNF